MYDVAVTIVQGDGTKETITLNLASQMEFEEVEQVSSILEAFLSGIGRRHELRLAWLAWKQEGRTVPADLKAFAGQLVQVSAELKKSPFGEAEFTE